MSDVNTIEGRVSLFWETGMEHVAWAFEDAHKTGYGALNIIEEGDMLRLDETETDAAQTMVVLFDYDRNKSDIADRIPGRTTPYIVQTISGMVVHGVPRDIDADTWLSWFKQERPGTLIKAPKPIH